MITVVIATYNGEKYIKEQLDSILNQTLKVDEIVISDDGSIDKTLEICNQYAQCENRVKISIVLNTGKHGFYNNFCNALKRAKGDYIMLCDQDDIWEPNKVRILYNYMEKYPNILSLASTFQRFNEQKGVLTAHQKHPYYRKNHLRKISRKEYLNFYNYLGMSMIVRQKVVLMFLGICLDLIQISNPIGILSHDIIINYIASVYDGFYYLDLPLTLRRSYKQSTSALHNECCLNKSGYSNQFAFIYREKAQYMDYFAYVSRVLKDNYMKMLLRKKQFYIYRSEYIEKGDCCAWIKNVINISQYMNWTDYLKDGIRLRKRKKLELKS